MKWAKQVLLLLFSINLIMPLASAGWICLSDDTTNIKSCEIKFFSIADDFKIFHDRILEFVFALSGQYIALVTVTLMAVIFVGVMISVKNYIKNLKHLQDQR